MSAVSPLAVASASNVLTAWSIGCGEIWISPPNPRSNSRIIPNAPATASAQSVRVTADVRLRGANRPKLANSKVSQNTRRARNAFGVPCLTCCANNQRVSPIFAASVMACPSHHWSRLFEGFKASSESSSCWSSVYVDGATRSTCAGWSSGNRSEVFSSAYWRSDKCLAAGMDDYIAKPVTLDRLAPALAKCRPLAAATAAAVAPLVEKQRIAAGTALDRDVLDHLREDLGGTAALREVIGSFLDQTPSVLSALRDAAARADVPSIRRAAHMIKGTSSILGARELSEQCAEIERVGQTGCIADTRSRVIAIEASYRTIEAALKAEIGRLGP